MQEKQAIGRNAIVVGAGASAGLGAALCRRFAKSGLRVFAAGRTQEKLEALAREIAGAGGELVPVAADTTVEDDVVRLFDRVEESGGAPELVVYNAGNNRISGLVDMGADFFESVWRVSCFGGFLVGREAARRMLPAGGTLMFTGATASIKARPPFTAFASAKAALRALAFAMAREFGPQGLHVGHVIVDGAIDGEMINSRFPQLKQSRGEDGLLSPDAMAESYWSLHLQQRSAWTLELDLRPYKESF